MIDMWICFKALDDSYVIKQALSAFELILNQEQFDFLLRDMLEIERKRKEANNEVRN